MEEFITFNATWPWSWPWIGPYGIPSCITHWPARSTDSHRGRLY